MSENGEVLDDLLAKLFKAHPWHGIVPGADPLRWLMPTSRLFRPMP